MKLQARLVDVLMNDNIISLHSHHAWRIPAARWFQEKWEIPLEEYLTSIDESIRGTAAVPQWYIAVDGGRIIAGSGVIANDFHDRKDLTPNVCALYVEPELRRRGIAGHLLAHICKDMAAKGIGTLYLITEHTSFYERYGWEYLCMVQGDGGESRNRDGFIVSSRKCFPVFPINERKALASGAVHRAFLLPVSVRCPRRLSGRHS